MSKENCIELEDEPAETKLTHTQRQTPQHLH